MTFKASWNVLEDPILKAHTLRKVKTKPANPAA